MSVATPALAAPSAEDKRAAAEAKKAQAAAQLDVLKANDAQLEDAVRALDAGVATQASTTDEANQSLRTAEVDLGSAQARLANTESRMSDLRRKVSQAAVRAYVNPGGDTLLRIVGAKDLGEASRRQALLAQVVGGDRDVVDQMRAIRQDQQMERENLAGAQRVAAERRKAAAEKLAILQQARNDQVRLKSALDARITEFTQEADAAAREEAALSALIRSRQLPSAAVDSPAGQGGVGAAPDARGVSGSGVAWPTSGIITSPFGQRWGKLHAGYDIANSLGTPIKAAKTGTVIQSGSNGGYGISIIIDHGNGFSTMYAHMSQAIVTQGQVVKQGQQIGMMGSTGNSTGNHLHFETRVNGTARNPGDYLP